MENYNDEVFEFGNDTENDLQQTNNFNYDSISGLGESDYENEDLFNVEVESDNYLNDASDFRIGGFNSDNYEQNVYENNFEEDLVGVQDYKIDDSANATEEVIEFPIEETDKIETEVNDNDEPDTDGLVLYDEFENASAEEELQEVEPQEIEEIETEINDDVETDVLDETPVEEQPVEEENKPEVTLYETPIEELNKLTEYEEDKIEETNINDLFDRVSVNVKDASEIFRKNTDLKQKIDTRFEELKKLQSEIENSRKKQIDEINSYKEEVLNKLTEKKEEIEKRLNLLKESQATLEKEKQEFEQYKKKEQENIDKVQKEVQSAYDDRREELNHIEDVLRKQKDALDEERSQLSLDKIQYESDKNELANNLLKFNELVNSFTNGVNDIKE